MQCMGPPRSLMEGTSQLPYPVLIKSSQWLRKQVNDPVEVGISKIMGLALGNINTMLGKKKA